MTINTDEYRRLIAQRSEPQDDGPCCDRCGQSITIGSGREWEAGDWCWDCCVQLTDEMRNRLPNLLDWIDTLQALTPAP